jgi:hypothetical protein
MYNRRFYEYGGDTMQPDSSGQGIMQTAPQGMQQQGMPQPPLADQAQGQGQPQIKDPNHALQIIIQMLIAQGIPPEQAKQIAMQMIQAVAQGGMGEMDDNRIQARFGGIMHSEGREHYGIGSIFKSVGKAVSGVVKGVTSAVKSVASSPIGKAALAAAAIYYGGPMLSTALGGPSSWLGIAEPFSELGGTQGILGFGGQFAPMSGSLLSGLSGGNGILNSITSGASNLLGKYGTSALIGSAAGVLGGALMNQPPQQNPGESDADYQKRVADWNAIYKSGLTNPTLSSANNPETFYANNPFYAQRRPTDIGVNRGYAYGGRIGYEDGGISGIIGQATKEGFFGTPMLAHGGVPTGTPRQNQHGVKEIDYRDNGGYVPPIGIKEKADDIPAMLSNNEFVFTADAVRNAGHGDVNEGAHRMYKLMKHLEAGGVVA